MELVPPKIARTNRVQWSDVYKFPSSRHWLNDTTVADVWPLLSFPGLPNAKETRLLSRRGTTGLQKQALHVTNRQDRGGHDPGQTEHGTDADDDPDQQQIQVVAGSFLKKTTTPNKMAIHEYLFGEKGRRGRTMA